MEQLDGIEQNQYKWPRQIMVWIIALSVILRIITAIAMGNQVVELPGTADQISYHNLALRVLEGDGFTFKENWWPATRAGEPTAHWSFLYTLYLVVIYTLFGVHPVIVRIIQAVIVGVLHPILAYKLAKQVFNYDVGIISAGLTAIYAYFVYYSSTLMTEPFFIIAILGSLYAATLCIEKSDRVKEDQKAKINNHRWMWVLILGVSIGIAVLLRQLYLLFVPFLFIWMAIRGRKQSILPILITVAVLLAMILPITAYNFTRFGRFVLLNTNAGYALFWANHPIYGTHFQPILTDANYYDLIPKELLPLDEAALDQALMRRGIQFILDDPVRYLQLSISRIPVFFMFWPSPDSGLISNISRVFSFGILWPFMLFGLVRALTKPNLTRGISSPCFLLTTFVLVYTGIHLLSWALIRYRLPVDSVMLIFSGLAFTELGRYIVLRRQHVEKGVQT